MMRWILCIVLVFLAMAASAMGDAYPIGTYSYLKARDGLKYYEEIARAGYTFHLVETLGDEANQADTLLARSARFGLDVLLIDRSGGNSPGFYEFTRANFQRFEAESSPDATPNSPQESWYSLGQQTGSLGNDSWVCDDSKDRVGYALKDVQYRINGEPARYIFQYAIADTLFFRVCLSWKTSVKDVPEDKPVVSFSLSCRQNDLKERPISIPLRSAGKYSTTLYKRDLEERYQDFTFYCPTSAIPGLCTKSFDRATKVSTLDFELYWHGDGVLNIDYLDIFDDVYRDLESGRYTELISNRLESLSRFDNLHGIYAKDEPCAPQFKSIGILNDIVNKPRTTDIPVMTANWLGMYLDSGNSYKSWEDYLDQSGTGYLCLDIYPISSGTRWNKYSPSDKAHVQKKLDFLTDLFRRHKQATLARSAKFFTINQTTGFWYGNSLSEGEWKGQILPPSQMVACLRYLPLCYGADGMFDWKFVPSWRKNGDGKWKYFYHRSPIDENGEMTPQYEAIARSNERIAVYGKALAGLTWLGADRDPEKITAITPVIRQVEVESSEKTAEYEGYVEVGIFQGDEFYLMLVNRRTNFLRDGNCSRGGTMLNVGGTGLDVDDAFEPAPSQIITLSFDNTYSRHWHLEEVFDQAQINIDSKGNASIEIPPGEGRLYRLAQ